MNCRHQGGKDDCPPACLVVYGHCYATEQVPAPTLGQDELSRPAREHVRGECYQPPPEVAGQHHVCPICARQYVAVPHGEGLDWKRMETADE